MWAGFKSFPFRVPYHRVLRLLPDKKITRHDTAIAPVQQHMLRKACRTATLNRSIWRDLAEDDFRRHLVELEERTNAVPVKSQTFALGILPHRPATGSDTPYTLPLDAEQQIANDFAFLAAIAEGAQSVAAACIEEHIQPPGLVIRFAAMDIWLSDATKTALQDVARILANVASFSTKDCASSLLSTLFDRVVKLHQARILARLRSVKWSKPKHLLKRHDKPLWQDFANLDHRVQFLYTKKESSAKQAVRSHLSQLASVYETFEFITLGFEDELASMAQLIRTSFDFCKSTEVRDYAHRLHHSVGVKATTQVASAIKCLRQVEKIAAYWRICKSLIDAAELYPSLFQSTSLEYLTPYESIPTTIGHESWAKTCHVHAEVQLIVHYDVLEAIPFNRPRAIGTSKYLCYLCFLFMQAHESFSPANTHGRLYDQWTIPDLVEFDENVCSSYRRIIEATNNEVVTQIAVTAMPESATSGAGGAALVRWRAEPMTSREDLLGMAADTNA